MGRRDEKDPWRGALDDFSVTVVGVAGLRTPRTGVPLEEEFEGTHRRKTFWFPRYSGC